MDLIEITDSMPEPMPSDKCSVGPESHRWTFSIDSGGVSVTLADGELCPPARPDDPKYGLSVCEEEVFGYLGIEALVMGPLPVRLSFVADHPNLGGWHGDMRCDCNWWWEVRPEPIENDDARERDAEKGEG
jgi:hypothetical protein